MILEAKNIFYSYGEKILLKNISLCIENNDKIGLIGTNGTGKSTLLSILSKIKEPEKGEVNLIGKKVISYMEQEIIFTLDITINEYLNKIIPNEELKLFEAKSILTQLDINDFDMKLKDLSGGSKRKLALGLALVRPSDLIILDEPTNHLDSYTIEFLEKFLIKSTKAIFFVTHDRYFLDRVANKIYELDNGEITFYEGNYSKYLSLKSEKIAFLEASQKKLNSFLRKEYEWYKRGALARTTKDKRRMENYETLSSNKTSKTQDLVIESMNQRLGNKTIIFDNVSFSYNDKLLFKNLSFNLDKDERIGIVGRNGTGKTTLLNLINGVISPSSGSIEIGETIKFGYFKQENVELDYNKRCIDYINDVSMMVKTKTGYITSSQLLERFLFNDPYIYIGKLSGGEKRRLYLCSILMSNPNVLLFDEPTNDLDIKTLSILEDYLDEFNGIVITVSHDRYFLDRVCDKILALDNCEFKVYNGNYSYYLENKKEEVKQSINKTNYKPKEKIVKLTYKEQIEFDSILDVIDKIEKRISELDDLININYSDYSKCKEYLDEKESLEQEYLIKLDRWEYLNNIYERSLK